MGQHTWFLKSKELYLKQNELYDKLDKFENNEIYLDNLELLQINTEIDEIDRQNDAEKQQIVELTLEDISNGKGVGVPPHLIRIKK